MWTAFPTTAVTILLLYTTAAIDDYGVFCPKSAGDFTIWYDIDVGINIWASSDVREADCFLRVSTLYNPSSIGAEFINPSNNMIVVSHGWRPGAILYDHYISDQWGHFSIFNNNCIDEANQGDVEQCAPMDHDAQYWIENGWNVLYIDWMYYAATFFTNVVVAEEHLYVEVYDGKSVNLRNCDILEQCPSATVQCQSRCETL